MDVGDAQAGAGNTVRLKMASADGSTCSLGITPSRLEIEITSGTATVWQSSSCPDGLAAKNVVVRPQPAVVYSLTWDGRITSDACSTKGKIAAPGGYWVEAALIGGAPHKSYFAITAPHPR